MHKSNLLIFLLCLSGLGLTSIAQDGGKLKTVYLNQEDGLLASPSPITVSPGDTLQFVAEDGNFSVFIPNAVTFLRIRTTNESFVLNSEDSGKRESILYIVRDIGDENIECAYSIYSIGNDGWPLAPPRIIIQAR